MGYRALIERFGHTQEQLSAAMGKSRSHIANLMRLLTLPEEVQSLLRDGKLTAGHARALIPADDPGMLARKVVLEGLSVRQTEALLKSPPDSKNKNKSKSKAYAKDADTRALEADISAVLGMPIDLDYAGGGRGKVTVTFSSMEQLDRLCSILGTPVRR